VKGFEAVSWYGIFVPTGTPKPVIDAINRDVQDVFASAEFKQAVIEPRMLGQIAGSAEKFGEFVKAESAKWKNVVEAAQLKVN
jgi:tripartite-type tricarboxylate transporter receptor subunit TctC